MIKCSPLCASGISKVKKLIAATPSSMTVRRLQWSEIAAAANPPTQAARLEATASKRISPGVMCSGFLASTSSVPVIEPS